MENVIHSNLVGVLRIQVCCNETMVALFKRLDPMMLKGKEHPIAPFVCIAQQGSDMWETHKQLRMIGRIKLQNSVRETRTVAVPGV